jgi:pilus assembly protein TadC
VSRRLLSALSLKPARVFVDKRTAVKGSAPMPGPLVLDLIAAVVQSGAPPQAALRSVGASLSTAGDPRGEELLLASGRLGRSGAADDGPVDPGSSRLIATVEQALVLAARSGLPPTALVRRAAAEQRRRQISAQLKAIRRLEVLLVIPAGLCLLPAFVLLGIVPLVVELVTG